MVMTSATRDTKPDISSHCLPCSSMSRAQARRTKDAVSRQELIQGSHAKGIMLTSRLGAAKSRNALMDPSPAPA